MKSALTAAKVLLAFVLIFGAYRWFVVYQPPEIKGMAPASTTTPATVPSTRNVESETPLTQSSADGPGSAGAVGGGYAALPDKTYIVPPSQPVLVSPPSTVEPVDAARNDGPSETDMLEAKIRGYRAQYRPLKVRVESLEREVAELSEKASRFFGGDNTGPAIEADAVNSRLRAARNELDRAQIALRQLEERARRDGVSYGQLY